MQHLSGDIVRQPNTKTRVYVTTKTATGSFSQYRARKVRDYHRSIPTYQPTPLADLTAQADFVVFITAGLPQILKGEPPAASDWADADISDDDTLDAQARSGQRFW